MSHRAPQSPRLSPCRCCRRRQQLPPGRSCPPRRRAPSLAPAPWWHHGGTVQWTTRNPSRSRRERRTRERTRPRPCRGAAAASVRRRAAGRGLLASPLPALCHVGCLRYLADVVRRLLLLQGCPRLRLRGYWRRCWWCWRSASSCCPAARRRARHWCAAGAAGACLAAGKRQTHGRFVPPRLIPRAPRTLLPALPTRQPLRPRTRSPAAACCSRPRSWRDTMAGAGAACTWP